ncbi:hypothetical protein MJO29_007072 [Puccinia striiformis f. sp. tritici]|nr:hypothetical protein MJO29_007072 [Puccinia striiformis f. sp. tritici]
MIYKMLSISANYVRSSLSLLTQNKVMSESLAYPHFNRTTGQYPLFQDFTHGRPPTTDAKSPEIEPAELDAFAQASDPRENCGSLTIEAATEDGVTEVAAGPRASDNHQSQTATAKAVSSIPETASALVEPVRHARKCDEGCVRGEGPSRAVV